MHLVTGIVRRYPAKVRCIIGDYENSPFIPQSESNDLNSRTQADVLKSMNVIVLPMFQCKGEQYGNRVSN